jgi:hypothetical protein
VVVVADTLIAMATAIAPRNNYERDLVKMGRAQGAASALKRGYKAGLMEGKKRVGVAKRNAVAAATENRMITGVAGGIGAVAGAALQAKVIEPNIQNTWAKRLTVPVVGGVGGLAALALLDETPAAAVGGGLLGTAIGSGIYQLADWLASS